MGYNNESRSAKSNNHKTRIVDCAMKLINEKGFDHVSVAEITKEAGVSKGAFYIHFKSKEDLIEQQITSFYDEYKLDQGHSTLQRLSYFVLESVKRIQEVGLKLCQEWFSASVKGSFFGKTKLAYDKAAIAEIVGSPSLADEIVAVYYGALNLWCFTDGEVPPEPILLAYFQTIKGELHE